MSTDKLGHIVKLAMFGYCDSSKQISPVIRVPIRLGGLLRGQGEVGGVAVDAPGEVERARCQQLLHVRHLGERNCSV